MINGWKIIFISLFSKKVTIQPVSLMETESSSKHWFLEPTWLAVWRTILYIILSIIFWIRKPRKKPPKFPFEIIDPKEFSTRLEKLKMLTETQNKYLPRIRNQKHSPEEIQTSRRRILIIGRADIGKTREAYKLITEELLTGSDPGKILMPKKTATLPEEFSDAQTPPELVNKAVVLFYDDLPNIYPSEPERKESKLATSQSRLQKVIECFERKTNQFHLIATARSELIHRLDDFDYKKDPFWNTFEIFEVQPLDKKLEKEFIQNLAELYNIDIENNAVEEIQKINECYSCESIVIFLQNRKNQKIGKNEVESYFKKTAFDFWQKNNFEPLKNQKPEEE